MNRTLDEYLREVDQWKEGALQRRLSVPSSDWASLDREARAWLETKLGRPLESASETPESRPVGATSAAT